MSLLEVPTYCQNFRTHFRAGTGRQDTGGGQKPWNRSAFLTAYEAAIKDLSAKGAVVSDRTLRDWLNEKKTVCPQRGQYDVVVHVFFWGAVSRDRTAFDEAWVAAQETTYKPRNPPLAARAYEPLGDRPVTEDWELTRNDVEEGVATLDLHAPPRHNDPDLFHLRATLSLAEWKDEVGGIAVRMHLREAYLRLGEQHCQIESKAEPERAAWHGRILRVTGTEQAAMGDVLDHDLVATMRRTAADKGPKVTMEVRSRRLDLAVVPEDPAHAVTPLREKLL